MIFKKSVIVFGIAGIASFIIGGCGLGANFSNDPAVSVENTTTVPGEKTRDPEEKGAEKTSVAETEKKEDVKTKEVQSDEDKSVQETGSAGIKNDLSDELVRIQEEKEREKKKREEEIAKQEEENRKQIEAQQEEYNRQLEAKAAEYKAAVDEYNAEVEAYNKRMSNYYYNSNPMEMLNNVNINPGHIIYDANGDLYATCFVSNGLNKTVYNITVNYIELYDDNGNLIARDENVPIGNGGAIGAHAYNTWTFVFSGDKIVNKEADLTKSIVCRSGVRYLF